MLDRRDNKTSCTEAWITLHTEYGLGRLSGKQISWSHGDLKEWKVIFERNRPAHEAAKNGATRTEVSEHTPNDKLTAAAVQKGRLSCHTINAPLYLKSGAVPAVTCEVEYRVHYQSIDISRYSAFLIIENLESFIRCRNFKWPRMPATLVLYRGHLHHDIEALQRLLDGLARSAKVFVFPDTDPSGLNIAMSLKEATHIIAPNVRCLDPKGMLRDRFALQLQGQPNLQARAAGFSNLFEALVTDVLQTGAAVSQEWLCANKIPLEIIPMK